MKVLCVLSDPAGPATDSVLDLARFLSPDAQLTLAVPSEPARERLKVLRRHCDVAVVPMTSWNRKIDLPGWFRPLAWLRGASRTMSHIRPVTTLRGLIKAGGFDVVYSSTARIVDGAIAARMMRVPHVWRITELIGEGARARFPFKERRLVRYIAKRSARIVCVSEYVAAPFRRQGIDVDIVPDGVDADRFWGADGTAIRKELDVADDAILVGMVGALGTRWKRHDLFLQTARASAELVPGARFVIFGSAPAVKRGPYGAAARNHAALVAQVHSEAPEVAVVASADRPAIHDAIDILVHPCDVEPFGRAAAEAMAAGRPVVGIAAGGVAEVVEANQTGILVGPDSPVAMAEAISALASDEDLRLRLGAAGRVRVEALFSMERHTDALLEVFRAATGA